MTKMPDAGPLPTFAPGIAEALRARKRSASRLRRQIAIVGMGCRFPGSRNPSEYWSHLLDGDNAVTRGRPDWPTSGDRDAFSWGGYLAGIDRFDAAFFRIAPVEARSMDPQQRLLLETSWEALEDAGMDPRGLEDTRAGVYAGVGNSLYQMLAAGAQPTMHTTTGNSFAVAAGRIAFTLGLRGPAMALDTACSSSLVAIHQAIAGLQRGEADLALACGVNAILLPDVNRALEDAGMLAPDGRCKTFDAAADGYVRGEGCGVLVLKRLGDAERDGDRILGVLLGSAVNQDGASAGLTVPNRLAQEEVIGEAIRRAGIEPSSVDYLEAHGTGTELGDPIELHAAATAYGEGRDPDRPLLVGSVKTGIGHLEAAAGVAGVIKVVLAMRAGVVPKHLHFNKPSPRVDWDRLPLRIPSETTEWSQIAERPRRAGVSAFGFSGTNAHLILQEYADKTADPDPGAVAAKAETPREARVFPLSGRSAATLRRLAGRYRRWMENHPSLTPGELADAAWTAGTGRSHFPVRAAPVFRETRELRQQLAALAQSEVGRESATPGLVAFLYTGQGSQWAGMGRGLYEQEPIARRVMDRLEGVFRVQRQKSLLAVMFGASGPPEDLDATSFAQPALYAFASALTELWASVGIRPDVVLGHSVGELAAATAAGVFGLDEGMEFATRRGGLMGSLPFGGGMTAVFAPGGRVRSALDDLSGKASGTGLGLAADNGAHQVVSGPLAALTILEGRLAAKGIRTERLRASHGFHSALMDPILDDIEVAAAEMDFGPPSVPLVSNVTGRTLGGAEAMDAAYWRRQARSPVAFRAGVESLAEMGVGTLIEIGPRRVLGPMASLAWPGADGDPKIVHSLDRETTFASAVAAGYEAGLPVSFAGLFAGERRRRVSLPTYPFEQESFWVEEPRRRHAGPIHPLLGSCQRLATGAVVFETEFSASQPGWLKDHEVFGLVVAPGAFFAAQGAAAVASEEGGNSAALIEDVHIETPLVFADEDAEGKQSVRSIQVLLGERDGSQSRTFEVFSRAASSEAWVRHVAGRVCAGGSGTREGLGLRDFEGVGEAATPVDPGALYRKLMVAGLAYGPAFRGVAKLWSGRGEAFGEVRLPNGVEGVGGCAHPALLDACFQILGGIGLGEEDSGREKDAQVWLPVGWERFWLSRRVPARVWCHARALASGGAEAGSSGTRRADLGLYGEDGQPVGSLRGFLLRRGSRSQLLLASDRTDDLRYEMVWRATRHPARNWMSAGFLRRPRRVAAAARRFGKRLRSEGPDAAGTRALSEGMEFLSRSYALSALRGLGWSPQSGEVVTLEALRRRLRIVEEHRRLLGRMLSMLGDGGFLIREEGSGDWRVAVGSGEPPAESFGSPEELGELLAARYPDASLELGLLRRCGGALAELLRGREEGLGLLFGGTPSAADLYRESAGYRAVNRLVGEAVSQAAIRLPEGRRLRVVEVGAGTGGTTGAVLEALPAERLDYTFTDVSAGFLGEAEERFGGVGPRMQFRTLDIEEDPGDQGFEVHHYDLVLGANVLHATRDLGESLGHCQRLLAPSGLLVLLEGMEAHGWLDLTFGLLPGWWRFDDIYRTEHALVRPPIWRRALSDVGYGEVAVVGTGAGRDEAGLGAPGLILARGPERARVRPGLWVVWSGDASHSQEVVRELQNREQRVLLADEVEAADRESWRVFLERLPADEHLSGVVHLGAVSGYGREALDTELRADVQRVGSSALAMTQGLQDAGRWPSRGIWFVTRGAQVVDGERAGELSGSVLWGFARTVAQEMPDLGVRLVDLPSEGPFAMSELAEELLFPDRETQVAYREGRRLLPRLVRSGGRVELPAGGGWRLRPDPRGSLRDLEAETVELQGLGPGEVRAAVEAAGLNFHDVLVGMGLVDVDSPLGGEFCGRVLEVGPEVTGVSAGDRVVGFGPGTFGPEVVTWESVLAPAPPDHPAAALATMPVVFVTAALAFEFAGLSAGDSVLVHAGTGGVGHAAIQWARAAGLRVFGTASEPKQAYLRSLGVEGVFDSRSPDFGEAVLSATDGAGVQMVLNSLTGEGFIEASLSCLAEGGRFVEIGKRGIWSEEEMASVRPDVGYLVLAVDQLQVEDPARVGSVLRGVMERVGSGALQPLPYRRYPLSEAGMAMERMREARHVGKLVLTPSALAGGGLRADRSYLVTGGLGGIGIRVAGWLAERGAGAIVLNGRRDPDEEASAAISELRSRGVEVRVEICDVTDGEAVDRLVSGMGPGSGHPPLGGVIHSVGVLSDGSVANQDWERFARVLWPKVLGAWHLHRATLGIDLELFVLFSSFTGVLGGAGQANHAAANAFLDQLALHRRAQGLPAQAIQWGAWSGLGEAEEQRERIAARLAETGSGWMPPEQGLAALEHLLRADIASSAVVRMDWSALAARGGNRPALLEELVADRGPAASRTVGALVSRFRDAPEANREALLLDFVREEVRSVLRLPSAPSPEAGFFDLGMDSLMAVELRNRVNRALAGTYVAPNTVVFDHPNAGRLAQFLLSQLGEAADGKGPASRRESGARGNGQESDRKAEAEYERVRLMEREDFLAEAEAFLDSVES